MSDKQIIDDSKEKSVDDVIADVTGDMEPTETPGSRSSRKKRTGKKPSSGSRNAPRTERKIEGKIVDIARVPHKTMMYSVVTRTPDGKRHPRFVHLGEALRLQKKTGVRIRHAR